MTTDDQYKGIEKDFFGLDDTFEEFMKNEEEQNSFQLRYIEELIHQTLPVPTNIISFVVSRYTGQTSVRKIPVHSLSSVLKKVPTVLMDF